MAKGIETVIVTMGSRGAMLLTADAVKHIAPVSVTPVDTTGAGDAFVGSFARYYVAGAGLDVLEAQQEGRHGRAREKLRKTS